MSPPEDFRELVEPYRHELHLHCYRLLGSLTDAEDLLQETLIAAWRGRDGFEGRASVRTWLYRIATNRCLNARRDAARRVRTEPVPPFTPPEPTRRGELTWLEPWPEDPARGYERRETVELAFIAALQRMPPRQAAVLLLRDVLGFPAAEVASMLGTTGTAVKGALQRARAAAGPAPSSAPPPDSPTEREVAGRFAEAFLAGDVDGVVALLTDDAWLSMPPAPHEYHGLPAVDAFLRASLDHSRPLGTRLVPVRANTQPAFAVYLGDAEPAPAGLIVLTLAADRITAITRFHTEGLLPRFGLPAAKASG